MRTRSSSRSAEAQLANSRIPADELLHAMEGVRGRTTKNTRQRSTIKGQSVGSNMFADMSAMKRRRSEATLSANDGGREKHFDRVVKVVEAMRRSKTARRPAEGGGGDEDNDLLGKGTPSIRASKRGRHDKINQQSQGTPTISLRESCQMTAKMRWKNRARTMIKETETDLSPSIAHIPSKEQNVHQGPQISPSVNDSLSDRINSPEASPLLRERRRHSARSKNGQQLHKKRKSNITATKATLKAAKKQHRKAKGRARVCGQQIGILKRLKFFLQSACEHEGHVPEATNSRFIMTENDREDLVQRMVEHCRNNADLRSSFLDSVKVLAKSGVMHSAALNLWQECPCEETEEVIKAWEEFKLQKPTAKGLPMDLLKAVVKLHEKRKDLSGKFTKFEDAGFCSLRQICDGTWQIQLQECLMEKTWLREA